MKSTSTSHAKQTTLADVPAFWPMTMAAALAEQGLEFYAKNLRFVEEEIKIHEHRRPALATKNRLCVWRCGR